MTDDRNLIAMEQGLELFNHYANSLNVVIVSKIKGLLDDKVLRQSLDLAQLRHPRLNSHIVGSLNTLKFQSEGTAKIPLQVILNPNPEYWQIITVNELNTRIESEKVLIRATLLKTSQDSIFSYFITTIHHAIIDATSGIYLHSEILSLCQEIVSDSPNIKNQKLTAYPSLEEIISNHSVEGEELPRQNKKVCTLPCEEYVPHQQRRCGLIQRQLDNHLTQSLIKQCKHKEQVTVHGAICSAMMLALAKHIKKEKKDFYFSCRSSVDMRRRVNPPVEDKNMAMLVSALTSFHEVNEETNFWDLAKQVTLQIKARLKTPEIYKGILSYRQGAEHLLNTPKIAPFSIFVTNIGSIKIPSEYTPFQLEEISYALSTNVMGSVFGVSVSTFLSRMTLNFIYTQPLISQKVIEKLIKNSIEYLLLSCQ